ncbi:glycoside hydrolase family 2 TIM barrel-domain containing protein, partial [Streptomyces massasporeus]
VTDSAYKSSMLTEFAKWVDTYKSHPATLMWNVGNESVLGLQNCYSGTELEAQRNAYTTFVNDVAKRIHSIDPDHPVTSTDAWTGAWPYYQRNAPDLDLYSMNAYGDICGVREDWVEGGYTKPYIITETGPAGEWETPKDANGVPDEPTDVQKADGYTKAWNCVTGHQGVALGATVFHYGTEHDFGGVWFNLLPDGLKRLSSRPGVREDGAQVGVDVRVHGGQVRGGTVVRVGVEQHQIGAEPRRGGGESGERGRVPVPGVQLQGAPGGDRDPEQVAQQDGVGERAADRASGEPAPGGPAYLSGPGGLGRVRESPAYTCHGGEGHGVDGGPVHGLGAPTYATSSSGRPG